ncbi:MAG: hypothetical protein Q8M76_00055, partial [Spirochaetaceae bacterium]|nr:hypothetical protein [Spirochaetaceae bacterium]
MKRKEFVKLMAAGIGGALLTACGGGANGGGGDGNHEIVPVPNGYKFLPLLGAGDSLPTGTTVSELSPIIMVNDRSEVLIDCIDSAGAHGVYEYYFEHDESRAAILSTRKLLREGDILPDGIEASHFHVGSTNNNGNFAIRVSDAATGIARIYLELEKGGLRPVVKPGDPIPSAAGAFASSFGDLDLDDTDSLVLASHYVPEGGTSPMEGVFHLAGGSVSDAGSLLLSSGEVLSGAGASVHRIGLL